MLLLLLLPLGCGYRKPATHEPVMRAYPTLAREAVTNAVAAAMTQESIPIKTLDVDKGVIVSDSFEVLPEYCDCGKNLLGADYVGTRRGVLTARIARSDGVTVSFEFKTRLVIRANNKTIICTSFGILEEKILSHVEARTGVSEDKQDG